MGQPGSIGGLVAVQLARAKQGLCELLDCVSARYAI